MCVWVYVEVLASVRGELWWQLSLAPPLHHFLFSFGSWSLKQLELNGRAWRWWIKVIIPNIRGMNIHCLILSKCSWNQMVILVDKHDYCSYLLFNKSDNWYQSLAFDFKGFGIENKPILQTDFRAQFLGFFESVFCFIFGSKIFRNLVLLEQ